MTYSLTIGRHQLAVSFNRRLGRPRKTAKEQFQNFLTQLIKFSKDKRRNGHSINRALRFIFESKKTRQMIGLNLAVFMLVTSVLTPSTAISASNPESEITITNPAIVRLTTEASVRVPLDSFNITQGYHLFHRAIDLKEVTGAPIYPIMEGTVEQTNYGRFSYGNHVIIDHGSGFKSLYAHLNKIAVKNGEKVDKNMILGTIGSTGLATGSHLHLEVYDQGELFNPLTILK